MVASASKFSMHNYVDEIIFRDFLKFIVCWFCFSVHSSMQCLTMHESIALSWWDVTGCNSFASSILMLVKTCKKHLFYFISVRLHTSTEIKYSKINAERCICFTFILFHVRLTS